MYRLVVKENLGTECPEKLLLFHAAQEEGFIDPHIPCPQRADHPLMCGSTARGDKRRPDRTVLSSKLLLQGRQLFQKFCEGSLSKRFHRVYSLILLECLQPFPPENCL